ncbi:MAG: alkaline phosphatase [Candidatus Scalindua sp.]|nr:alkaline phosphatase [Candidatus Scalindua sp.]
MKCFVFLCFAVSQLVCMAGYAMESSGMVKQNTSFEAKSTALSVDPLNDEGVDADGTTIPNSVKNVILMIGDGMGPQQVGLAVIYAEHAPNSQIKNRKLNIEKVMDAGETGVVMVGPYGKIVVDSACSTTQFATGKAVPPEAIGVDIHGNPLETILEKARNAGKSTGLVSDTTITHATPAAFAVHVADRMAEDEIAEQLVESKADIMLSGGLQYFLPMGVNRKGSAGYKTVLSLVQNESLVKSKRKDQKNLLLKASENGYELIFNKKSLLQSKSGKVLGLFCRSEMPDGIICSQTRESLDRPPTLKEMTQKAISLLSVNKEGFFLMVEGGLIDYAGHANDTGWLLHEMLKFDEAVGAVFEWMKDRKDTLLIITADHETGSFGFSYSGNFHQSAASGGVQLKEDNCKSVYNYGSYEVLDKIYNQKKTLTEVFRVFDALTPHQKTDQELKRLVNENLEFEITLEQAKEIIGEEYVPFYGKGHHPYLSFQSIPVIHDFKAFYPNVRVNRQALTARKIAEQQQVVWGTGTHTSTPVFVIAFGPEAVQNRFDGLWHSTDIGKMMIESMGL